MSPNLFLLSNPTPWIILVFFLSIFVSSFPNREQPGSHYPYCACATSRSGRCPTTVRTPSALHFWFLLPEQSCCCLHESPITLLWAAVSFLHLSLLPCVGFLTVHTRMLLLPPSLVDALFMPVSCTQCFSALSPISAYGLSFLQLP